MSHNKAHSLNSEEALLIECINYFQSNTANKSVIESLTRTTDWSYLIDLSSRHGLKALLYQVFNSHFKEHVSPKALYSLENYFQTNLMWNKYLYEKLIQIIDLFNSNNIPVIAIKGPVMAKLLYGDIALREFSDLDILVDKADIQKAKDLLISIGYRLDFKMPEGFEVKYERYQNYYNLIGDQDETAVDLHWRLMPEYSSFAPSTELIMSSARPILLDKQEFLIMQPEYLLIYLSIHGAKHSWVQLNWVLDLSQLILTTEIDWDWVINESKKLECEKMVYLGLLLASDLFSINLPDPILNEINSEKDIKLYADRVYKILFPKAGNSFINTIRMKLFFPKIMTSYRDKIMFFHNVVLKPTSLEWAIVSLPSSLYFLYYLIRPTRLGVKYLWKFVNHLRM